jgi:hypothetical protein
MLNSYLVRQITRISSSRIGCHHLLYVSMTDDGRCKRKYGEKQSAREHPRYKGRLCECALTTKPFGHVVFILVNIAKAEMKAGAR